MAEPAIRYDATTDTLLRLAGVREQAETGRGGRPRPRRRRPPCHFRCCARNAAVRWSASVADGAS